MTGERATILSVSHGWLGVPYRWAGASRSGVDCSGLTMIVYKAVGISLIHNSAAQMASPQGKSVSQNNALPGDLVFFGASGVATHVGIWLGGNTVRHAPHPGAYVRDESLASIASTVPLLGFRNYLGDRPNDGNIGNTVPTTGITGTSTGPSKNTKTKTKTGTSSTSTGTAGGYPTAPTAPTARNPQNADFPGGGWDPLNWPGQLLSGPINGAVDTVETAALKAVIFLALLGLGAGLVLVGAAATARSTASASGAPTSMPVPIPA